MCDRETEFIEEQKCYLATLMRVPRFRIEWEKKGKENIHPMKKFLWEEIKKTVTFNTQGYTQEEESFRQRRFNFEKKVYKTNSFSFL